MCCENYRKLMKFITIVIGRRVLALRDEIPKNYVKLLTEKKELKEINKNLKLAEKELDKLKKIKSSGNDSATRQQTSERNKSVRGLSKERHKSWRVLRSVLTFPLLGKSFVRDFSPLRPVLVEGKWERMVKGRVPVPGAGAMGSSKKPPAGALSYSEGAEYKYPSQNCTNVQFC
ncbi:MAG: hypothetical protein DSY34_01250 [Desulfurobacterium sp.]|nr:MAG: hypothetical protein DSY34_01250 [Desulfurobacterium sp.]